MTIAVSEPLHSLSSCLDTVRESLRGLDDNGIVQTLREIEELSRRTQSVMLDVVAEADARGIAAREGFGSTARLLAGMLRLSTAEARIRCEHAAMVGARRALTGEALPPRLPETAAALAGGEIGTGQLRVITETMAALPASLPEPVRERAEADLAAHARDFDPRRLRIIAHRLLANLDPDGLEPTEDPTPATPARGELWLRDRRDGKLGLEGWLDPEHGSMVRALIEQLATRRRTIDGMPDERSTPERQADALIELCDRARATDEFPTAACGTGSTAATPVSKTAACSATCTISKCTCKAGTSLSRVDGSNSAHPRLLTRIANLAPIRSAADLIAPRSRVARRRRHKAGRSRPTPAWLSAA